MKFIAITKHNSGADGSLATRKSYGECVDIVHAFFLSYDFELKDGKPFDEGNDDGKEGGFEVFTNVTLYDGKVAEFTHAGGDGPVGEIRRSK
jgi:hypothetical protein